MSARVERLRRAYEAFNQGDFEALRELGSEDLEMRVLTRTEPIRGTDAAIEWFQPDAFDQQRVELRDIRERDDVIYAELEVYGRGASSGIEVQQPGFIVYEYEGDQIRRMTNYADRGEALAAAGLAPG